MTHKWLFAGLAVFPLLMVPFAGCGGDDSKGSGAPLPVGSDDAGTPPWGEGGTFDGGALTACDQGSMTTDSPSGYLLITQNRLAKMKADAAAQSAEFKALKDNTDQYLTNLDGNKAGPENAALMYLLTNDAKYATSAMAWVKAVMMADLSGDSYLEFGDMLRAVALTLNWTKPALSAAEQKTLADYLDASCNELWFHAKGSMWGLDDSNFSFAGNNYRMSFLQGTAYAGYALKALGDSRGDQWIALLVDKLERKGGIFDYINQYQLGGDWLEGTNYGERSKQRLFHALSVVASMGGKNYFTRNEFFPNSIIYGVYQAQPGNAFMYPAGDLASSSEAPVTPQTREHMQIATYWLCDSPAKKLGQYYVTKVAPTYMDGSRSYDYNAALYLDVLFATNGSALDENTLPLSYRAKGSNWVNARSGWDSHATSVSISGSPVYIQSHQDMDMGSFVIWKEGWQAVNPESYGGTSLYAPEAHTGLFVPNRDANDGQPIPGLTHYADKGAAVYVQVDNSGLYRGRNGDALLNEHTREIVYLRPDTVIVFDRVDAKPANAGYALRFHFAKAPSQRGSTWATGSSTAGISLAPLLGGAASVARDDDLGGSMAQRLELAATGTVSRYLNVLQVAPGGPPQLAAQLVGAPGSVRGAFIGSTVIIFSDLPRGATPPLPITYTVPTTAKLTHMIVNMSGSYSVKATQSGGSTTITIAAGTDVTADGEGVLVVSP